MYHVSGNGRSRLAANKLYESLFVISKETKFEKVTIKKVCDHCGVARSTFYRLFDNVEDILLWKCQELFYKSLSTIEVDQFSQESDLIKPFFEFWSLHHDLIELLIKINRIDIIYSGHQIAVKQLSQFFLLDQGSKIKFGKYFIPLRTSLVLSILMTWIESGKKEDVDELIVIARYHYQLLAKDQYVSELGFR